DLEIKKISSEITNKAETIQELSQNIESGKRSLEQLIRKTNEIDHITVAHAILSGKSISEVYGDLDTYALVKRSVHQTVGEVRGVKTKTEEVKKDLEVKQVQEIDAKKAIEQEKSVVERSEKDQQQLLNISKNQEAEYARVLAERQAEAARIRS